MEQSECKALIKYFKAEFNKRAKKKFSNIKSSYTYLSTSPFHKIQVRYIYYSVLQNRKGSKEPWAINPKL